MEKGRVCVTGATGYLASWLVKRLLEDGYIVNATVRMDPERKRDISFLTKLSGASERLHIYDADLDKPESFAPSFVGCVGVFHLAHPLDFEGKETEETKIKRVVNGVQAILQACLDSETVKRVIYTSSISTVAFSKNGSSAIDENSWTDVELIRSTKELVAPYVVTKVLTEKTAQEFAEKNGLDLVTILPTWTTGPFLCPKIPESVQASMAFIFGDNKYYKYLKESSLVHVDDVARAHIFLFEYQEAKGRYLCSYMDISAESLTQFLSLRYPQYPLPMPEVWKDEIAVKASGVSMKRLLEAGFKYEKGLEDMFDGAIQSCKEKGFLK